MSLKMEDEGSRKHPVNTGFLHRARLPKYPGTQLNKKASNKLAVLSSYLTAVNSISTIAFFGKPATCTVVLAGSGLEKYSE